MKILLTITLLIFIDTGSFAQKFSAAVDGQLALPQDEYKSVNADAGYGLRANLLFRPGYTKPVKLGLELGIQEKARASQYFSGNIGGYYDDFKISATSNIFSLMFVTRVQSPKFRTIKPFVDLTAGWNIFSQQ